MKNLALLLLIDLMLFACDSGNKTDSTSGKDGIYKSSTGGSSNAFPAKVFFGDTHLHTDLSMDAGAFGNRIGMDEAYRICPW